MKGLIRSLIILLILVVVGAGASAFIHFDLQDTVVAERQRGFEEGRAQGYEEGWQEGHKTGYQEGSRVGYEKASGSDNSASNGDGFYFVYNPTYGEVQEMLATIEAESAEEIHEYAEGNGVRVAYVRCQLARKAAKGMVYVLHLVAFKTVDNGFVIIEPWAHREVKVEVGKSYSELNGFPPPAYDDTITKMTIVW